MRGDLSRLEALVGQAAERLATAAAERERLASELDALRGGPDGGRASDSDWESKRLEALALIDEALS